MNAIEPVAMGKAPLILAMHSSSATFGVAVLDLREPQESLRSSTFPIGRKLSNNLLSCVEELLPSTAWKQLKRLAVATGPGGFTGTRLSVVMARTLAQQLKCPLDGLSSFALMAPRLASALNPQERTQPFWIVENWSRERKIAGKYQIQNQSKQIDCYEVLELEAPQLLKKGFEPSPVLEAKENVDEDVRRLIAVCLSAHKIGKKSHWSDVVPIYPTSPVEAK